MKVGIDFDNTIVNTKEVTKLFLDKYLPGNKYKSYHDLSYEEELKFFMANFKEITENLTVLPGVKKALKYFKDNNIETYLITARGSDYPEIIKPTKEYLKKHDLKFDKVIFSALLKGDICFKEKINIMIDDSYPVIENVNSYGIKTIKFGEKSNKHEVNNWEDIIKIIDKMKQEAK